MPLPPVQSLDFYDFPAENTPNGPRTINYLIDKAASAIRAGQAPEITSQADLARRLQTRNGYNRLQAALVSQAIWHRATK